MDLTKLVLDIFEFNKKYEGQPIWPCFVGPHGEGKTSRVVELSKRLNLPIRRLTLQTMRPEDVGGYPRPLKNGAGHYVMKFVPLAAFYDLIDRPGILFLDELDKPNPETLSTLLSILTERQVSAELKLHPDTVIVCAMQPSEDWLSEYPQTRDALASRLVQLPVDRDFEYVARKYGFDPQALRDIFTPEQVSFYIAPTSSRTIDWLCSFLAKNFEYVVEEEYKPLLTALLQGTLKKKDINPFLRVFLARGGDEQWLERIASSPSTVRFAIENWDMPDLVRLLPYVLAYCPEPLWVDVWKRINELDEAGEQAQMISNVLRDFISSRGGGDRIVKINVKWFPDTPEKVAELFNRFRLEVELPYYEKLRKIVEKFEKSKGEVKKKMGGKS